jgi:hypothetical protein
VTNGANIDVWLGTCEFFFTHFQTPKSFKNIKSKIFAY